MTFYKRIFDDDLKCIMIWKGKNHVKHNQKS